MANGIASSGRCRVLADEYPVTAWDGSRTWFGLVLEANWNHEFFLSLLPGSAILALVPEQLSNGRNRGVGYASVEEMQGKWISILNGSTAPKGEVMAHLGTCMVDFNAVLTNLKPVRKVVANIHAKQ